MKIYLYILICLSLCRFSYAQERTSAPIQYDIQVELIPNDKLLKGTVDIYFTYDSVRYDTLFIQLYPNAYSEPLTALGEQLLQQGKDQFYFAEAEERGWIKGLDFHINGTRVKHHFYHGNKDIAYIYIGMAMQQGEQIHISTPFTVKIPSLFSRMGYEDRTFHISQWFPKLMRQDSAQSTIYPYLDMGEYYGTYADYAVDITVPSEYKVAATGMLQSSVEKKWYRQLSRDSSTINPYSEAEKTLHYEAHLVQDFAWFTSPEFTVKYDTIHIQDNTVECWVFHHFSEISAWDESMKYCKRALKQFSRWVGPYKYPQMTIVGAGLQSGAGMEYPMLCLIATENSPRLLDQVIAHEIGHNWFYGMIASNERKNPFMDEGLTSQLEVRYMKKYYVQENLPEEAGYHYPIDAYYYWNRLQKNFSPGIHARSTAVVEFNYYLLNYRMMPNALEFLRYYAGNEQWNAMMHSLYKKYLYRHLSPAEFAEHLRNSLDFSTDWFIAEYMSGEKAYAYVFTEVERRGDSIYCTIQNNSGLMAPLILQQHKGDSLVWEDRIPAFANRRAIAIPAISSADSLSIYTAELYTAYTADRSVNLQEGKIIDRDAAFRFLLGYEPPEKNSMFISPAFAYNKYDGFMLGIALYNYTMPDHRLQYQVLPYFGLKGHDVSGLFELSYDIYSRKHNLNRLRLNLKGRRFHSSHNEHYGFRNTYLKLSPSVEYRFKENYVNYNSTRLGLAYTYVRKHQGIGTNYLEKKYRWFNSDYSFLSLNISRENTHPIHPFKIVLSGDLVERNWRTSLELRGAYRFSQRIKAGIRVFTGLADAAYSDLPSTLFYVSNGTGFSSLDYGYDAFLLGRSERKGTLSQQVFTRGVSFPLPVIYPLGKKVLGGNITMRYDFGFVGIEPYLYFTSTDKDISDASLFYALGARITLAYDIIHLNFPISTSTELQEAMELQGHKRYWERITFSLDLSQMLPSKLFGELFSVR